MENYNFKLQKLLDIREDKEEESKRRFKDAQLEKEKVEEKLNSLKANYNKYKSASTDGSLAEQKLKHIYLSALSSSIEDTADELETKVIVLDEKREDLKQKQIERKTVETLKEKQHQMFIKEQALIEQKTNDEFALYSYIRARGRR